jgi:hypothetical protein
MEQNLIKSDKVFFYAGSHCFDSTVFVVLNLALFYVNRRLSRGNP